MPAIVPGCCRPQAHKSAQRTKRHIQADDIPLQFHFSNRFRAKQFPLYYGYLLPTSTGPDNLCDKDRFPFIPGGWRPVGSEHSDYGLSRCAAVYTGREATTFRKKLLPPSSRRHTNRLKRCHLATNRTTQRRALNYSAGIYHCVWRHKPSLPTPRLR